MKMLTNLVASAGLFFSGAMSAADSDYENEIYSMYSFAYPLVLMEVTKEYMLSKSNGVHNSFIHHRELMDNSFDGVVAVNVDTLYSTGYLSLAAGPVFIHIPDTTGHYFMMPILDAWTNVIAEPGTRNIGSDPHKLFVTGPNWDGDVPDDHQHVQSPTNTAWVIGRIRADSKENFSEIHKLQDKFLIYQNNKSKDWKKTDYMLKVKNDSSPDAQVREYSADVFFSSFCKLLRDNPAAESDSGMLERLKKHKLINKDCLFPREKLNDHKFIDAYKRAINIIDQSLAVVMKLNRGGWRIPLDVGRYGNNYQMRSIVAKIGLGANTPEDAVYPSAAYDKDKNKLNGSFSYEITFPPDSLPPVKGFWSITSYNSSRMLFESNDDNYAVGDRSKLKYNDDGSLTIFVRNDPPANKEYVGNWLFVGKEDFNLVMRLYWPKESVLSGVWTPPLIEKVFE